MTEPFGDCLKRLRLTAKHPRRVYGDRRLGVLSQSELAEKADFDHSYVSRLESGSRMPTREAVDRLGEALSLDQSQLDALLAAAGFLPRDVSSLLSSEPVIGEVLDLLQDDSLPVGFRDGIRQGVRAFVTTARFAIDGKVA